MRIDFEITYRGETVNLDLTASQMVVSFTLYDGNFPNGGSGAVSSVNGKTGAVVLDASDIAETTTLKWLTTTLKGYYDSAYTWVSTHGASVLQSISDFNTALNTKADLVNGKVPANQLPSYVDDVIEYSTLSAFPNVGENGKIYVTEDTNKTYRWTGTAYANLDDGIALGETELTAYRGDRGKEAYDLKHSHSNKSTLDAIEQALTTALKTDYDAVVTAMPSKANLTQVQCIISKMPSEVTLTTLSGEQILYTHYIPANTLSAKDLLIIRNVFNKSTSTGTTNFRIRVTEDPNPASFTTAHILATFNSTLTNTFIAFDRNRIFIKNDSTWLLVHTTSNQADDVTSSIFQEKAYNRTVDLYIHITAQNVVTTDVLSLNSSVIYKL